MACFLTSSVSAQISLDDIITEGILIWVFDIAQWCPTSFPPSINFSFKGLSLSDEQ